MEKFVRHVSKGGRVTYHPYIKKTRVEIDLTNAEICSAVAAWGICCLHGFEAHLPEHALISRKVRALEVAIGDVAGLNYSKLSPKVLQAATAAWEAAVEAFVEEMGHP